MQKKSGIIRMLPAILPAAMILALAFAGIFSEDKAYSATERRPLQTLPAPSAEGIYGGSFQEEYEAYLSDQFPGRDGWVRLRTLADRLAGRTECNGVFFGRDGYLLERYAAEDFESERATDNIAALAGFVGAAASTADVHVMLVPTKTWAMRDKLPRFAPAYDERQFYERLEGAGLPDDVLIRVDLVLEEHADEEIYYRTDHHWTTLGAWYGYAQFARAAGIPLERVEEKREFELLKSGFYGTSYAKALQGGRADDIYGYMPVLPLRLDINMGEKSADGIYDMDYLQSSDPYSVFAGGNQAVIEISGGERNGRTLLLVKDSFANCMMPFLAEDFEKVVAVDPRYFNAGLSMALEWFRPTDVLVLYNTAQFAADRYLAR